VRRAIEAAALLWSPSQGDRGLIRFHHSTQISGDSMATLVVPKSALQILEMTLDVVKMRANADGEVFGGQIGDAMGEAGTHLGIDRLDVLLVRTVLVRTMVSLGESYPADLLQNHETRIRLSDAVKYLQSAIESATRLLAVRSPQS
jgi:hypothetical protein